MNSPNSHTGFSALTSFVSFISQQKITPLALATLLASTAWAQPGWAQEEIASLSLHEQPATASPKNATTTSTPPQNVTPVAVGSPVIPVDPLHWSPIVSPLEVPAEPQASQFSKKAAPAQLPQKEVTVSGKKYTLTVRQYKKSGDASLYINKQEVIRFRHIPETETASEKTTTPVAQATQVLNELTTFLQNGGSADDITAAKNGNTVVVKAGKAVLTTLDDDMAQRANHESTESLSRVWAWQVRKALGGHDIPGPKWLANLRHYLPTGRRWHGGASWYGPGFHGRTAADGSRYNMHEMTAAHKTLPFGTIVRVKNHNTGKACMVKITDRGPYIHGRIIDLSKAAAQSIGLLSSGVAKVTIEIMSPPKSN